MAGSDRHQDLRVPPQHVRDRPGVVSAERLRYAWKAASYARISRTDPEVEHSMFKVESFAYRGPAIFDPNGKKYQRLDISDSENQNRSFRCADGWLAGMQHHFTSVIVPNPGQLYSYTLRVEGRRYYLRRCRPVDRRRPRRYGGVQGTAFRRPEAAEAAGEHACRAGSRRRLRHAHLPRAPAVHVCWIAHTLGEELGPVHHLHHLPAEAALLSAGAVLRPPDGAHAPARAAHEAAAGNLQGRSREARPRDDGAVPHRESQSALRLPAHAHPDAGVHRVLLGAARERRDAPGAVLRLDQGSVRARSVLHPAGVMAWRCGCSTS